MKTVLRNNRLLILLILILCILLFSKKQIVSYSFEDGSSKEIKYEQIRSHENKKVLVISDPYDEDINDLTKMIQGKIECVISDFENAQVEEYDLILIGVDCMGKSYQKSVDFIKKNDFTNKDVSFYYVHSYDNDLFEKKMKENIKADHFLDGIGFNGDELSQKEDISFIMDGWLTSVSYVVE